jgi:pyruvate,water dikinase
MVDAVVAGVLFTANPVTGRRGEAVIDASPGLGEAIVSGAVNPDHLRVRTASGEILERRLGDRRVAVRAAPGGGTRRVETAGAEREPCLSDTQARALAELGARVEALRGSPQDLEWAVDAEGRTWLTQARPITTLYPLPAHAPPPDGELRAYFSVNVAQGVLRPFTPMGIQAFELVVAAGARLFGRRNPGRRTVGFGLPLVVAGQRLFVDATPALRDRLGRRLFLFVARHGEARTSAIVEALLAEDARLAPTTRPPWRTAVLVAAAFLRAGIPPRAVRALARPDAARARAARAAAEALALGEVPDDAGSSARLDALERLLGDGVRTLYPATVPVLLGGVLANAGALALLGPLAGPAERQIITRALPHNPTTLMDLALWRLAERVRADPRAGGVLATTPASGLAAAYRAGELPDALQRGLAGFLAAHGHRAVAEIDLGLPRWSEDPAHVLAVLAAYLRQADEERSPELAFRRAEREAEELVAELGRRAERRGRLRGAVVRLLLGRMRALLGQREAPKEYFVRLLARARALLWPVGRELAAAGRLEAAEDVFFLDLGDARAGLAGADLRLLVRERRAAYVRELRRREVPRILLSDGTVPAPAPAAADPAAGLRGTPASPGAVTAPARVMLGAGDGRLEPGEILVAPSTDPGWTPLFLTAGGLVMEMGGAMSHGAVVAREYGIPAVVGVAGATERIASGERITVDGTAGVVRLG